MKTFNQFMGAKFHEASTGKDWKSDSLGPPLAKGFIPPAKLRPVINAFLNSGKIELQKDLGPKPVTMPQKTLYLVGGPVRDFIKGKSIKDLDLATNATPEQTATILSSAGFKRSEDRSGRQGAELKLPNHFVNAEGKEMKIEDAKEGDNKTWFVKGRDNSKERKAFVISAVVDGEEFEIATFRKDAKVTDGDAEVDFVDNPSEDAARRDLTINAMYIELTKPDGENKTLYDPTKSGMHDLHHGVVKTVGKAEDRFKEDPLRVMRAIRFHCRFGSGAKLHPEIEKAIPNFRNLDEHVALDRIKKEFLLGLMHPDVDVKTYLQIYKTTGLLSTVFPGLAFDAPGGVPTEFSDKKDKPLALAWLLQHNPIEKVAEALGQQRKVGEETKDTGWQNDERKAVLFLLKLKDFNPEKVMDFVKGREGTGLSNQQVRDWVDMFNIGATKRNRRPWWAKQVKAFSDFNKGVTWEDAQGKGKDVCPTCKGNEHSAACSTCKGTGKLPPEHRGTAIHGMEVDRFKEKLGKESGH